MPGRKKKKFIDKKHAVTFNLVHRSQRDPLQADEDAPQHVLLPTDISERDRLQMKKEEERKYGVFFDDEYDYMQHMRDTGELHEVGMGEAVRVSAKPPQPKESSLQLPSSVFASNEETDIGLLNKAAPDSGPRLDWDPDIVAALDDDFDFDDPENQLDDDFVVNAMGEEGELSDEEDPELKARGGQATLDFVNSQRANFEGGYVADDVASDVADNVASDEADFSDARSDLGSDFNSFGDEHSFTQEETKSRFTNYSMTSSVIRRNQGLTLVDDRFEKIYEQYDDEEIGALDHEDITGYNPATSELLDSVLAEFEKTQTKPKLKDVVEPAEDVEVEESESDEDDMITVEVETPKEKWDCESILNTYSTLYNHPKTIQEPKKIKPIKLTSRAQIPADTLPERGLTLKQIEAQTAQTYQIEHAPTYRPKDETPEERRERKAAVKEERKNRREQKKATKEAFKEEKKKQSKELHNVRNNLQGMHIS